MMFTLKVMALASACGFGSFFGWYAATYLFDGAVWLFTETSDRLKSSKHSLREM